MKKGIEVRVAAILVRDDRILLVRHHKKDVDYWVLPGGHVEPGETLPDALRREMREELQLDVDVGPLVFVHDFIRDGKRHVVNNVFLTGAPSTDFAVVPQGALQAARFFAPTELHEIDLRPDLAGQLSRIIDDPPTSTLYLGNPR